MKSLYRGTVWQSRSPWDRDPEEMSDFMKLVMFKETWV